MLESFDPVDCDHGNIVLVLFEEKRIAFDVDLINGEQFVACGFLNGDFGFITKVTSRF